MSELMTIGRFARASGLSARALRLYDERCILRPATVDARSGYRYYHLSQLREAEVIHAARSLGMPLAEIRELLADDPPEAHERLDRFWASLTEQLRSARDSLAKLHRAVDADARKEWEQMDAFERGNELYFRERNIDDALAAYLEVPEEDVNYATARRYIGHNIYGREWSRWSDGLPYLEEAFRVAPDDPKVLEDIGRAYARTGRLAEGKELLSRAGTPVAERALRRLSAG